MNFYFFSAIKEPYKEDFQVAARRQNQYIACLLSQFIAVASLLLAVFSLFSNDYQAYRPYISLGLYLFVSSAVFCSLLVFIRAKLDEEEQGKYHFLAWGYGLNLIGACTWLCCARPQPVAAAVAVLVAAFCLTSVTLVLNRRILLGIMVLSLLCFIAARYFLYPAALDSWGFCLLLLLLFLLSRLIYTYHANHFVKIRLLEEKDKAIERLNKLRSEMVALVVHDLRGPVTAVQSVLNLMLDYPFTQEQAKEYVLWMQRSCNQAEQVICNMLVAARQKERSELQTTYTSINELLKELYQQWKQKLEQYQRNFLLKLPVNELTGKINAPSLQQALNNLLENAAKFTPENGTITLSLLRYQGGIRIAVADDGIGIPEPLIPNLFDRFSSSGRPGLNNEVSNGLGLHIARQLVENHGGTLSFNSQEGKGTTFNIDLPFSVL